MALNSLGIENLGILARRAFALTFRKFPMSRMFTTDMGVMDDRARALKLGQQIYAKIRTIPTVGNFGDAAQAFDMTDVPVTLSNFRQLQFTFTPDQYNAADFPLQQFAAETLSEAITLFIINALGQSVSGANFDLSVNSVNPYLTVASAWTRANTVLPMKTALDNRGVPQGERFFLINSTVEQNIQADITVIANPNPGVENQTLTSGELPRMSGLNFFAWPSLPNTDGNLLGWAGTPDSLVYVNRAPLNPMEFLPGLPLPALVQNIIEPNSGFSVQAQFYWDPATNNIIMRFIWFDGIAPGNPNNLVRLISGAVSGTTGVPQAAVVTNPGYAYRNGSGAFAAPTVTVTNAVGDSTGSGMTAVATISTNGAIASVALTGGTAYTLPPVLTFVPSTSGGTGSVAGPATVLVTVGGLN